MITLKLIAITVILVMGCKVVTSEGMILEKLGYYFEEKVNEGHKIFDLFICPWCMNSLFSIFSYAFAFGLLIIPFEFNWQLIIRWPIVVCASSFISGNLWNAYQTINAIRERNQLEAEYYNSLLENKD